MKNFEISVDSTCDLYADELKNLGLYMAPLEYTLACGDSIVVEKDNYKCKQDYVDFYNKLRSGVIAKTFVKKNKDKEVQKTMGSIFCGIWLYQQRAKAL